MQIKILEALNGDSLIISFPRDNNKNSNLLIDGGPKGTYKRILKDSLNGIIANGEFLDFIVVTHVDNDHIAGIIELFEDYEFVDKLNIKKFFYNHYDPKIKYKKNNNTNCRQGDELSGLLNKYNERLKNESKELLEIICCKKNDTFNLDKSSIHILSPADSELDKLYMEWEKDYAGRKKISQKCDYDKKIVEFSWDIEKTDCSTANSSSISFLLEYKKKVFLMAGDANPEAMGKAIEEIGYSKEKKLILEFMKLSHHGGEDSISNDLLELVNCSKYLILTNGKAYNHPRKKTLVDIIRRQENVEFYFNYERKVFKLKECEDNKFKCFENTKLIHIKEA